MKKKIVLIISTLISVLVGSMGFVKASQLKKKVEKEREMAEKHLSLMLLLNRWLEIKQEGKSIIEYFHENKIKNIAIYGMSYVGERLYEELKNSDIEIRYEIDKNAEKIYSDVDIFSPEEELSKVDAIIVTPIFYFEEIEKMLKEKVDSQIISLEDILYEL